MDAAHYIPNQTLPQPLDRKEGSRCIGCWNIRLSRNPISCGAAWRRAEQQRPSRRSWAGQRADRLRAPVGRGCRAQAAAGPGRRQRPSQPGAGNSRLDVQETIRIRGLAPYLKAQAGGIRPIRDLWPPIRNLWLLIRFMGKWCLLVSLVQCEIWVEQDISTMILGLMVIPFIS